MKTEDLKDFIKVPDDYIHDEDPVVDLVKQMTILRSRAMVAMCSMEIDIPKDENFPEAKLYYLDY